MRLVLDTNILISACLKPAGLEAHVVAMVLSGRATLCVTPEVWAEYREVLARPKFAGFAAASAKMLMDLELVAKRVVSTTRVSAASDEDDNRFIECALACGAEYLVTGNLRHYPSEYAGIKVVNARQLVTLLG